MNYLLDFEYRYKPYCICKSKYHVHRGGIIEVRKIYFGFLPGVWSDRGHTIMVDSKLDALKAFSLMIQRMLTEKLNNLFNWDFYIGHRLIVHI